MSSISACWPTHLVFGTSTSTWYTNAKVQAQYQAYIKAVVSRYSSSAAIFAWELANEPRCKGCTTSVITGWGKQASYTILIKLLTTHLHSHKDKRIHQKPRPQSYGDPWRWGFHEWWRWWQLSLHDGWGNWLWSQPQNSSKQFCKVPERIALIRLQTLDFGVFHLYPTQCTIFISLLSAPALTISQGA